MEKNCIKKSGRVPNCSGAESICPEKYTNEDRSQSTANKVDRPDVVYRLPWSPLMSFIIISCRHLVKMINKSIHSK